MLMGAFVFTDDVMNVMSIIVLLSTTVTVGEALWCGALSTIGLSPNLLFAKVILQPSVTSTRFYVLW